MAGEHLPIFNYDDQTAQEIVTKIGILVENGSPNLQAIREYEESKPEPRKSVIDALDKYQYPDGAPRASQPADQGQTGGAGSDVSPGTSNAAPAAEGGAGATDAGATAGSGGTAPAQGSAASGQGANAPGSGPAKARS